MLTLQNVIDSIKEPDQAAADLARQRWDSVAKPLNSLGALERDLVRIAGVQGTPRITIGNKAIVVMCADNGIVEEGVTQTGQEVTAVVAENFLEGTTTCCVMCRQCGAELFPVDVGMVTDTKVRTDLKVAYGTRNMTREPAMTRDQAIRGIEAGIAMADKLKEKGYQMTSTVNDAYRVFSNNVTSPWVVDGKITVDDNIKNWVDMSKEMVDAGETATYELWSDDWSKGFFKDSNVFSYFGPAWFIDFSMSADQDGSVGKDGGWAATEGPQGFYWGGTWITAATGTDNPTLVADIMRTMTTNVDVMKEIVTADNDFVNNKPAMEEMAKDESYGDAVLGGQNPLAMFCAGADKIDLSNMSIYDQGCNEEFQNAMKNYFEGNASYDEALDLFYKAVVEKYPELSY